MRERENEYERAREREVRIREGWEETTVKSEVYQVQLVGLKHFKTSSATDSAFSVFSYPLRETQIRVYFRS